MSRKDYVQFANSLASHVSPPTPREWEDDDYEAWQAGYEAARMDIGSSVAAILALDNPNFDANRFYEAAKL
jgi:hypothetical protein